MVTKEVEVPAWLATWSDKHGIDYSDVLCQRLETRVRRFDDAHTDSPDDNDNDDDDNHVEGGIV